MLPGGPRPLNPCTPVLLVSHPCRTGTCGPRCGSGRYRATGSCSRPTSRTTPSDGLPTEQHAAYYAARAAGGAGLIITEEHSTHPTDWPYEKLIHGFHREVIPGYRRITDAVHAHGTPIFAQINHNGGQASSMFTPAAGVGAVARWPIRCSARCRRRSTHAEIAEIVAGYADWSPSTAPRRVRRHRAAVLALARSCAASCRPPPTGAPTSTAASLENRARLLLEIVAAVREAIGRRPGARRAPVR